MEQKIFQCQLSNNERAVFCVENNNSKKFRPTKRKRRKGNGNIQFPLPPFIHAHIRKKERKNDHAIHHERRNGQGLSLLFPCRSTSPSLSLPPFFFYLYTYKCIYILMYIDRDEYKASFLISLYINVYTVTLKKKKGEKYYESTSSFLAIPVSAGSLAHTPTHMEQKTQREIETPSISMQSMCVCVCIKTLVRRERERETESSSRLIFQSITLATFPDESCNSARVANTLSRLRNYIS